MPCFNGGSGITPTECSQCEHCRPWCDRFNGGSGITPTEYLVERLDGLLNYQLQWRVGYYPDRMGMGLPQQAVGAPASMEGRVLPRPNPTAG